MILFGFFSYLMPIMTKEVVQIREATGQLMWFDLGLPDLRYLARELRSAALEETQRATDAAGALKILLEHFGFSDPVLAAVSVATPVGAVLVPRTSLPHIVEKRPDSRERYVRHAIDTLGGPLEVWRVAYTNGGYRLAFINAYEAKNDMLVVVDIQDDHILWNFMHGPAKTMNRHRQGELLYRRYEIESKEKGQL
jgi:hypothetical protein